MKINNMQKRIFDVASFLGGLLFAVSCSTGMLDHEMAGPGSLDGGRPGPEAVPAPESGNGNGNAGRLTAGEWNDLDHWNFWSMLCIGEEYGRKGAYWGFNTAGRVAVKVSDHVGNPVAGARVELKSGDKVLWKTVSDNHGRAECWVDLFSPVSMQNVRKRIGALDGGAFDEAGLSGDEEQMSIHINGKLQSGSPVVAKWVTVDAADLEKPTDEELYNKYVIPASVLERSTDIAFIVDATGSMGDEIEFLKEDLVDILTKVSARQASMKYRTAALFYRDEGDDYLTKESGFTSDIQTTAGFVAAQSAGGGGDFPEAVHTALENGLQKLAWNDDAYSRIAFLILDAPAHYHQDVIASLHNSIRIYANKGIKIIPVVASGIDKNTEFMLRFFALATNGTYVFLTNDSGIGGDHLVPTVGKYNVELLNDLLVRLITYYSE